MRTITATLTYQGGDTLTGLLSTDAPELGAPVAWTGDAARIAALPAPLRAERCQVDELLAYAELHAEETGAAFSWASQGKYELMAV